MTIEHRAVGRPASNLAPPPSIPDPSTLALVAFGLAGLRFRNRRQHRRRVGASSHFA